MKVILMFLILLWNSSLIIIIQAFLIIILLSLFGFFYFSKFRKLLHYRNTALHQINEEHHLLRKLIDTIPEYIYIKDTDHRFMLANERLSAAMRAGKPDNLLQKTDFDFFPEYLASKYAADEDYILKTGIPLINQEEESLDENNHKIFLSTSKFPYYDLDGNICGIIGIGRDITRQKEYENKLDEQAVILQNKNLLLEKQNKDLVQQTEEINMQSESLKILNRELEKLNISENSYLSLISNDLKNPFNAIINFSELLLLNAAAHFNSKETEQIRIICSSSRAAFNTLENLIFWVRMQSTEIPVNFEKVNITELINDNLDFWEAGISLKGLKVNIQTKDHPIVFIDRNLTNMVFRNMMSTFIKYTQKEGEINIEIALINNDFIEFSISNSRVGMDANVVKSIFNFDSMVTSEKILEEPTTSIGMELCKAIVKLNHGKLDLNHSDTNQIHVKIALPVNHDN